MSWPILRMSNHVESFVPEMAHRTYTHLLDDEENGARPSAAAPDINDEEELDAELMLRPTLRPQYFRRKE